MSERDREPATTEMSYASPTGAATAPAWSTGRPVLRRPDPVAGLLLLLAGTAALLSLVLPWLADGDATGLDLMRRGFSGLSDVVDTGLWQPLVIVLGGVLLFALGVRMLMPSRSHRTGGLVALAVSGLVVWAVLVPLVAAGFDLGFFDAGFWCGIAVAVCGVLGAAKAVLTGPRKG